jgi:hypothetical protein
VPRPNRAGESLLQCYIITNKFVKWKNYARSIARKRGELGPDRLETEVAPRRGHASILTLENEHMTSLSNGASVGHSLVTTDCDPFEIRSHSSVTY